MSEVTDSIMWRIDYSVDSTFDPYVFVRYFILFGWYLTHSVFAFFPQSRDFGGSDKALFAGCDIIVLSRRRRHRHSGGVVARRGRSVLKAALPHRKTEFVVVPSLSGARDGSGGCVETSVSIQWWP